MLRRILHELIYNSFEIFAISIYLIISCLLVILRTDYTRILINIKIPVKPLATSAIIQFHIHILISHHHNQNVFRVINNVKLVMGPKLIIA